MAKRAVTRKYKCPDTLLMQRANVNVALLEKNLPLFTAKDPHVDAAYVAAYKQEIDDAENEESADLVEGSLRVMTYTLGEARKLAARAVADLRYYVLRAFSEDAAMQYKFGLHEWDKVRRSQPRSIQFLKLLHSIAQEHSAELNAAGFGAADIAGIGAAATAIQTADRDQEAYKNGRKKKTADRINSYNAVYSRMVRVNALAQIVFRDSYAERKQFVFQQGGKKKVKKAVATA